MAGLRLTMMAGLAALAAPALAQSAPNSPNFVEGGYWASHSLSLEQEKVRGLLEAGKVAAAQAQLQIMAVRGDAWAQWTLGSLLFNAGDLGGLIWIEEAATQGHAKAALVMGTAYASGQGFDRDPAIAKGWLLLAARRGDRHVSRDARRMIRDLGKIS